MIELVLKRIYKITIDFNLQSQDLIKWNHLKIGNKTYYDIS